MSAATRSGAPDPGTRGLTGAETLYASIVSASSFSDSDASGMQKHELTVAVGRRRFSGLGASMTVLRKIERL